MTKNDEAHTFRQLRGDLKYFDVDITSGALQDILGVSHETLRKLETKNALKKIGRGRFGFLESITALFDHYSKIAGGRSDVDDEGEHAKEKMLLTRARRQQEELKLKNQAGELLDVKEVERAWEKHIATARSAFLTIPSKISTKMPHLDKAELNEIDKIVRKVLTDLSKEYVETD